MTLQDVIKICEDDRKKEKEDSSRNLGTEKKSKKHREEIFRDDSHLIKLRLKRNVILTTGIDSLNITTSHLKIVDHVQGQGARRRRRHV